jgi:hypothetical protein
MRAHPLQASRKRLNALRRGELVEFCRGLWRSLFDGYRPEQHYMRGPGPRWCEKHGMRMQ